MKGQMSSLSSTHVPSLLPQNKNLSIFKFKAAPNPYKCGRIKAEMEIKVCVNRTCRRQGSMQTLEILSGIAPPDVAVKSCGCLGHCGAGPNLVVLPDGVFVGHCGTAARAADVVMALCGGSGSDAWKSLDALALRKQAEVEFHGGNFSEAELLLSQAIDLKPCGGIHIIYKDRSFAKLAMGDYSGALEDAKEAMALAPQYSEAYICLGDAFLAMNQFDAAEKSYLTSLELDPSIRHSRSFKDLVTRRTIVMVA